MKSPRQPSVDSEVYNLTTNETGIFIEAETYYGCARAVASLS